MKGIHKGKSDKKNLVAVDSIKHSEEQMDLMEGLNAPKRA